LSDQPAAIRRSFPADRGAPRVARQAVKEYLYGIEADPRILADVLLAVSEVVTNCVVHGYRSRPGGEVAIDARYTGRTLLLSIADRGGGMAPRTDSPGLGMGLPLIGRIAERVDLSTPAGGGTVVQMCFDLDRR
jgi:serine/threonine-protein kinase RsbW